MYKHFFIKARGHHNITAKHKSTLEITTAHELSQRGDCIIAVEAKYDLNDLRKFLEGAEKIFVKLESEGISDEIESEINPSFNDSHEIVFRLGTHASPRTLGIKANKSAAQIKRALVEKLNEGRILNVTITKKEHQH